MFDLLLMAGAAALGALIDRAYVRGRLIRKWYVVSVPDKDGNGYEVRLQKGAQWIVCFRVQFDRPSSPNPDHTFADQLTQARVEAQERAHSMNGHERRTRERQWRP
jgi:hypothetical protein